MKYIISILILMSNIMYGITGEELKNPVNNAFDFTMQDTIVTFKSEETIEKILVLVAKDRPPLHKGTKCDMRFKSSLNSARLNLLNPYK